VEDSTSVVSTETYLSGIGRFVVESKEACVGQEGA
jgi:hypothetical protein